MLMAFCTSRLPPFTFILTVTACPSSPLSSLGSPVLLAVKQIVE